MCEPESNCKGTPTSPGWSLWLVLSVRPDGSDRSCSSSVIVANSVSPLSARKKMVANSVSPLCVKSKRFYGKARIVLYGLGLRLVLYGLGLRLGL